MSGEGGGECVGIEPRPLKPYLQKVEPISHLNRVNRPRDGAHGCFQRRSKCQVQWPHANHRYAYNPKPKWKGLSLTPSTYPVLESFAVYVFFFCQHLHCLASCCQVAGHFFFFPSPPRPTEQNIIYNMKSSGVAVVLTLDIITLITGKNKSSP